MSENHFKELHKDIPHGHLDIISNSDTLMDDALHEMEPLLGLTNDGLLPEVPHPFPHHHGNPEFHHHHPHGNPEFHHHEDNPEEFHHHHYHHHHNPEMHMHHNRMQLMHHLKDIMNDFTYGYVNSLNPSERIVNNVRNPLNVLTKWKLASPEDVLKNKLGICFDQCEFERDFCNHNDIPCKTFFIKLKYIPNMHTVLAFQDDEDKWNVFENAFDKFKGIYGPFDDCLSGGLNLMDGWLDGMGMGNTGYDVYEYDKPDNNVGLLDFIGHCIQNKVYGK